MGSTSDSRGLFVCEPETVTLKVKRFDVPTGALTPWKEIASGDLAGASAAPELVMNTAGDANAYGVSKMMSDVFIVDGLH